MAVSCPQCQTIQQDGAACTVCGNRLPGRSQVGGSGKNPSGLESWMSNPWGRLAIGILLSQGLFFGLRHLATGAMLVSKLREHFPQSQQYCSELNLAFAIHGIALLGSGVLVGSSQRLGILLGFLLGLWSGVLSIFLQTIPVADVPQMVYYGQPLVQGLVGAVGASIGGWIWKPVATPLLPGMVKEKKLAPSRKAPSFWNGPIHWIRLLAGIAVVVVGSKLAPSIFEAIMDFFKGRFATETYLQDKILVWEIKILLILLGGIVAGASTMHGTKQGLLAGVGSCVVLPFVTVFPNNPQVIFHVVVTTVGISLLGGWFGSHLLPPVVPVRSRKNAGSLA